MCLDRVKKYKPCKVGYKVMFKRDGELYGEYRSADKSRTMGKWLDEKDFRFCKDEAMVYLSLYQDYPTGWHIYHFKTDALAWKSFRDSTDSFTWVVAKVLVENPVAVGVQGQFCKDVRVTVAQKIKVIEVIDK